LKPAEAAKPKAEVEEIGPDLGLPIAQTPKARYVRENGPAPHTAASHEAARRRTAARRQRGIQ
jgi:hypothetical protein